MESFVQLIDAIAWPATVIWLVHLFKSQLRDAIPFLKRMKAGPFEAIFEREIEEAKRDLEGAHDAEPHADISYMIEELASLNPRSAILEAWIALESALRSASMRHAGSPVPNVNSPIQMIKSLDHVLNPSDVALFHDLRGLRNQAAHLPEFSPSKRAALDYVQMAANLEAKFRALGDGDE